MPSGIKDLLPGKATLHRQRLPGEREEVRSPSPQVCKNGLNAHFFRETTERIPALASRLQLQISPCVFLASVSSPPHSLPVQCSQERGEVGFLPICSLGIAFPNPQPPFDPSQRSRMKTHFDQRAMSPPSNRSCGFQAIQAPHWNNCP